LTSHQRNLFALRADRDSRDAVQSERRQIHQLPPIAIAALPAVQDVFISRQQQTV